MSRLDEVIKNFEGEIKVIKGRRKKITGHLICVQILLCKRVPEILFKSMRRNENKISLEKSIYVKIKKL